MTSAAIVTLGQAMAMIPTMTLNAPSRISEVDDDLNMTGIPFFRLSFRAAWGRASPGSQWRERWSAGDVDLVADVEHAGGHPGGADGRVVFGPGADVTGQGHGVPAGIDEHVTVVGDERVAVQRVLHADSDSYRVGIVPDLDLVLDVADTAQPGDCRFGGGALRSEG